MGQHGKTPERMRKLRPGMSLRTLSKRTGLSLPHLSKVVNKRRGLTVRVARLIAQATGTTIDRVVTILAS